MIQKLKTVPTLNLLTTSMWWTTRDKKWR
jgi:hypothetical protein